MNSGGNLSLNRHWSPEPTMSLSGWGNYLDPKNHKVGIYHGL